MNDKYKDIIHLPHPTSKKHGRMSMKQRASQFMPFKAMVGYDQIIDDNQNLQVQRVSLEARYAQEDDFFLD